jgi:hypothetical protein
MNSVIDSVTVIENKGVSDFSVINKHFLTILTLKWDYTLEQIGQLIGHTEEEIKEYLSFVDKGVKERREKEEQDYKEKVKQYGKNSKEFRKNVKTSSLTNWEIVKIQKLRRGGESIHRISRIMNRDVKVIKSVISPVRFGSFLSPVSDGFVKGIVSTVEREGIISMYRDGSNLGKISDKFKRSLPFLVKVLNNSKNFPEIVLN